MGGKARIYYAGAPCFQNNFFLHSRKTYAARHADFAQTNGFKAFPASDRGILSIAIPGRFPVFPTKQSGYPRRMPSGDSSSFSHISIIFLITCHFCYTYFVKTIRTCFLLCLVYLVFHYSSSLIFSQPDS